MKLKAIIVIAILFFVVIQTAYFWEQWQGMRFSYMFYLLVVYTTLSVILIYQIYRGLREKFSDRRRLPSIFILALILMLTAYKPFGLVNFEHFENNDLLVAKRMGEGDCKVVLRLKKDSTFVHNFSCFAIDKVRGTYSMRHDTIYFNNLPEEYEYGVLSHQKQEGSRLGTLVLYKGKYMKKRTAPLVLNITSAEADQYASK